MGYGAGIQPGYGAGRGVGFGAGAQGRFGAGPASGFGAGYEASSWSPLSLGSSLAAWYRADAGCYTDAAMLCAAASSQYASRTGSAALRGGTTWWRSGFLYLTDTGTKRVLQSCLSGNDGYQVEVTAGDVLKVTAGTGAATASATHGTSLSATTWYFWYAYFDGTNIGISLNDGAAVTQALGAAYSAGTASFFVGCDTTPANYMNGALARNYGGDGTLSAGSITALYAAGAGLFYADLGATLQAACGFAYNLCEASGDRVDSVGALNLTPTNGPTVAAGPGEGAAVNNSPVKRWEDQSGGGHHLLQSTIANQPIYLTNIQNGKPVVRGNGTSSTMYTGAFTLNQPEDVFFVGRVNVAPVNYSRFIDGVSKDRMVCFEDVAGSWIGYAGSFGPGVVPADTSIFHSSHLLFNGASSVASLDASADATGNVGAANAGGITVLSDGEGLQWGSVDLAEFFISSAVVAAPASPKAYLKQRWGTP